MRRDGEHQVVLKGLHKEDEALYIEQQLERCLRIDDRPVRGEVARG